MAKINIAKLSKVKIGNSHQLPDMPGIYFALDNKGKVQYVGISTTSLRDRHQSHEKIDLFRENGVTWLHYQTSEDTDGLHQLEKECIARFNPPLNVLNVITLRQPSVFESPEDCLRQYHELKVMEKRIKDEIDSIKDEVQTIMDDDYNRRYDCPDFSLIAYMRGFWHYSDECKAIIDQLHKEEQKNGKAEQTFTLVVLHRDFSTSKSKKTKPIDSEVA